MEREKQIEKMARVLNTCVAKCEDGCTCSGKEHAETLYNAGYRKQSEGEWKDHYLIKVKCPDNGYPSVKCSVCEMVCCDLVNNHHFAYHFCPNCGAKMKGGEG